MNQLKSISDVKNHFINGDLIGEFEIDDDVYHHPEMANIALSSSDLKVIHKSIKHFISREQDKKASKALRFGGAFHAAILTPEIYQEKFVAKPKLDLRLKKDKEFNDEFNQLNKDKTIVDLEDELLINEMRAKLYSDKFFTRMMSVSKKEIAYFNFDDDSDELCRVKCDIIDVGSGVIYDVKTCEDATPQDFSKSIANYKYDLSAALYVDIVSKFYGKQFKFVFIAIEKNAPFHFNYYELGSESLDCGRRLYKQALRKIRNYREAFNQQKYLQPDYSILEMPTWALRDDLR